MEGVLDALGFPNPVPAATAPSIFVALPPQTGLKLIAWKGSVNVLVIEHVQQPSENLK
jgi:uncharacterized protein (TIGR03435 family)